jgi:hypothetical protein
MVFATILVELLQLGFIPGRDASTGDVLTNALGGCIGFLIGTRIVGVMRPSAGRAAVLLSAWLCGWLALQAVAGYALHPQPPESTYFGQRARALGGKPAYPGRVLSATISGTAIPDTRFDDSRRAQAALASAGGAALSVAVLPRFAPEWVSIVRIADQEEREVVDLAADKSDLVVGVRTGASTLRLRPLVVALRGAFTDRANATATDGRDTVHIRAQYGSQRVEVSASRGRRAPRAVAVALTAAKAWRLVSPVPVYADDSSSQAALDALWLMVCLAPAGFWAAIAVRGAHGMRRWTIMGAVASALVMGLVVVPAVARIAPTAPLEALGALAGFSAGATIARAMRGYERRARNDHPPAVKIVA